MPKLAGDIDHKMLDATPGKLSTVKGPSLGATCHDSMSIPQTEFVHQEFDKVKALIKSSCRCRYLLPLLDHGLDLLHFICTCGKSSITPI